MKEEFGARVWLVLGAFGFFALMVLARLFFIQTSAEAEVFRAQARENEYQIVYIYPARGEILDRN
ncbi:MAG: hypothetical protein ACK8QZ_07095, partial [Anaerolineales bacterium]